MKVLITGGAGFIGSHLADRLVARGDEVSIIDNLSSGRAENVPKEINFWYKDIGRVDFMESFFASVNPDVVVHAAASMKDPDDWVEDVTTNVIGTINVINQSIKVGVKKLIYLQTSLCYGYPQECPITLRHPINPTPSSYPISKVAAERYIMMSGLNYVSFRMANCYGPRSLSGPFATFYRELTAGRKCVVVDTRRDFVYVDDLMELLLMALDGVGEGVYHVSSGKDRSILEVYDLICEQLGMRVEPEVRERGIDDVPTLLLDPTRTREEFGMVPEISLEYGIARSVEWYREYGVGETYTHLRGLDGKRVR